MKPRFVSDIHLSEKRPDLTNAFKAFLNESKEACTHLFILGDLFEIWIGDDDDNLFTVLVCGAMFVLSARLFRGCLQFVFVSDLFFGLWFHFIC